MEACEIKYPNEIGPEGRRHAKYTLFWIPIVGEILCRLPNPLLARPAVKVFGHHLLGVLADPG